MRRVRESSITPLWVEDYYDGPLTGFCEYGGKPYYYVVQDDDWVFMHPLKDETWTAHWRKHQDFREHVGAHWDGIGFGRPRHGPPHKAKPQDGWDKFYGKYKDMPLPEPGESPPSHRFCIGDEKGRRSRKLYERKSRMERLKELSWPRFQ